MISGHLKNTIMLTYDVPDGAAEKMMDMLEIMSDTIRAALSIGALDGYRKAKEEQHNEMSVADD